MKINMAGGPHLASDVTAVAALGGGDVVGSLDDRTAVREENKSKSFVRIEFE
jgi:hypothetical protein